MHYLRYQNRRLKHYGTYKRRGQTLGRASIDARSAVVETRRRIGNWKLNTVIRKGHRQAIVSLTEHKSRLTLIHKIERATADNLSRAIIPSLKPLTYSVHTLISDNGKEFAQHETITEKIKARFCFAPLFILEIRAE